MTRFFVTSAIIAVAVAVGYVAEAGGVPLPWVLGPLFVGAVTALSGVRLAQSGLVRRGALVVVGTVVGHNFTSGILISLMWLMPWIVAFAIGSVVIAVSCALLLQRWAGLDRRTAVLANLPGGVEEMAFLGGDTKGASTAISMVQVLRVTSLVLALPFLLTLALDNGNTVIAATPLAGGVFEGRTVAILALGYAVAWGMNRIGIKTAFLLGALLVSILDSLTGFIGAGVPNWLFIAAQVAIGLALGARFERDEIRQIPRIVVVGFVVSLLTSTIIIGAALVLAGPLGIPLPVMTLAAAPGGMAEMMITAAALGLSIPEVVAFQTVRVLVVHLFAVPVVDRWVPPER